MYDPAQVLIGVWRVAEKLHGELATWEGEYTLHMESKPDHAAGTPFRITAFEHHTVAPGEPYVCASAKREVALLTRLAHSLLACAKTLSLDLNCRSADRGGNVRRDSQHIWTTAGQRCADKQERVPEGCEQPVILSLGVGAVSIKAR